MLNLKDDTTLTALLNAKDVKYTNDTGKTIHNSLSTLVGLPRRDLERSFGDLAWRSYFSYLSSCKRYIMIHNDNSAS